MCYLQLHARETGLAARWMVRRDRGLASETAALASPLGWAVMGKLHDNQSVILS